MSKFLFVSSTVFIFLSSYAMEKFPEEALLKELVKSRVSMGEKTIVNLGIATATKVMREKVVRIVEAKNNCFRYHRLLDLQKTAQLIDHFAECKKKIDKEEAYEKRIKKEWEELRVLYRQQTSKESVKNNSKFNVKTQFVSSQQYKEFSETPYERAQTLIVQGSVGELSDLIDELGDQEIQNLLGYACDINNPAITELLIKKSEHKRQSLQLRRSNNGTGNNNNNY